AFDADGFGNLLPRSVAELRAKRSERRRAIDRVEIVADDVFHQLLDEAAFGGHIADQRRNRGLLRHLRGAPAAFAVDDDVDIPGFVVPHDDRLQDAFGENRIAELFEALLIEGATWLLRIRLDPCQLDLARIGEIGDTSRLGAGVAEE